MARIRERIENEGYNEGIQSYVRTFGGADLDASLLVMPLVGYCDARSPKMSSTRRAIAQALSQNSLIYRYRPVGEEPSASRQRTDDGLPGREGAFGICNFWLAESFAMAGELREAEFWMQAMLNRLNSVGLFSEEIDVRTGAYLGNYPQAFTHIGLICAALAIKKRAEEVFVR
jgi:GH15 family glucan-1,4-alpha-glucosidase